MRDGDGERHAGARVWKRAAAAGWHPKLPPGFGRRDTQRAEEDQVREARTWGA